MTYGVSFHLLVLCLIFSPLVPKAVFVVSEPYTCPNLNSEMNNRNENRLEINPCVCVSKNQLLQLDDLIHNLSQLVPNLESIMKNFGCSQSKSIPTPKDNSQINRLWWENFHLLSAVKLNSTPTCVNVFPYKDEEGSTKYFAVGDKNGKLYVFLKNGEISLEINSSSPVTAVVSSLSFFKNEIMLVTGHENGVILIHRVWEMLTSDNWNPLRLEKLGMFENPDGPRVVLLEVYNVGWKRYIVSTDVVGMIRVLEEDGSLHGSVNPSRRPIAFLKKRVLFLTETGAGSLDLRTMKLKEKECEGLKNSFVTSYVFDVEDQKKAYGVTAEGYFVNTVVVGDERNFQCRMRFKRRLDLNRPAVALQSIRGYVFIATEENVLVYNVLRLGGSGMGLMFSARFDEITRLSLNQSSINEGKTELLIVSDNERIVLVSLGNGYVGMYGSRLPVLKKSSDIIFLVMSSGMLLIIIPYVSWFFICNRKEEFLTSWSSRSNLDSGPKNSDELQGSSRYISSNPWFRAQLKCWAQLEGGARNSELIDPRSGMGLLQGSSRYIPRFGAELKLKSWRSQAEGSASPAKGKGKLFMYDD